MHGSSVTSEEEHRRCIDKQGMDREEGRGYKVHTEARGGEGISRVVGEEMEVG